MQNKKNADTNITNYSVSDLLTILNLPTRLDLVSTTEIKQATQRLINKMNRENKEFG